jgi:hypothetical protein
MDFQSFLDYLRGQKTNKPAAPTEPTIRAQTPNEKFLNYLQDAHDWLNKPVNGPGPNPVGLLSSTFLGPLDPGNLLQAIQEYRNAPAERAEAERWAALPPEQQLAELKSGKYKPSISYGVIAPFLEKAPGLYSRVERAVDMIPKKGAKAESVLNLMQKAPGGLNPEELAWRKVPRFLEAQRGKVVTPDVMMEHLKSNPLDVSVKNLTPVDPATRHEYDKAIENIWSFRDRLRARNGSELLPDFRSPFPGNDFVNFETNVFDAAAGRVDAINWLRKQGVSESELSSLINEARIVNETSNQLANPSRYGEHGELPLVIPGGNDYRETLLTLGGPNDRFYSAHFDEPNILVHTRSNTRKLPSAGGPGRFLEEVQSDWHQLGKKNGYGPGGEVPDAPFKESWPDLALKQQLYETARDPEARWLGFTPGITQERRYSKLYQEDFPNDGMRKFYDQLLPKRLEKIVKPFGGRVSEWTMPFIEEYNAPGWLVRLTPEMKQRILQQGLPLLSLGGLAMTAGQEAEKNRGK